MNERYSGVNSLRKSLCGAELAAQLKYQAIPHFIQSTDFSAQDQFWTAQLELRKY
jgi:hypothetical protein